MVRSAKKLDCPPFHGGDTSSNLVGDANLFKGLAFIAGRFPNKSPIWSWQRGVAQSV